MKILLSIFLLCALPAYGANFLGAVYNLPFKAECQGQLHYTNGMFVCSTAKEFNPAVSVHLPPTKGRMRIRDCNRDLTEDGNPDDFNTLTWNTGWFIFSKKNTKYTGNPTIKVGLRTQIDNDCPVFLSVVGENTGVQSGVLFLNINNKLENFAEYQCGPGPWSNMSKPTTKGYPNAVSEGGLGVCSAFEGARVSIRLPNSPKIGVLRLIGNSCGILKEYKFTEGWNDIFTFDLPQGPCVLNIQLITGDVKLAKLYLLGNQITKSEIDSPTMIKDGTSLRVFKPLGASIVMTQIYDLNGNAVFRSGPRTEDNYKVDPGNLGAGITKWASKLKVCHSAFSEESNSMGNICYDLDTMTIIPFTFN